MTAEGRAALATRIGMHGAPLNAVLDQAAKMGALSPTSLDSWRSHPTYALPTSAATDPMGFEALMWFMDEAGMAEGDERETGDLAGRIKSYRVMALRGRLQVNSWTKYLGRAVQAGFLHSRGAGIWSITADGGGKTHDKQRRYEHDAATLVFLPLLQTLARLMDERAAGAIERSVLCSALSAEVKESITTELGVARIGDVIGKARKRGLMESKKRSGAQPLDWLTADGRGVTEPCRQCV